MSISDYLKHGNPTVWIPGYDGEKGISMRTMSEIMELIDRNEYFRVIFIKFCVEMTVMINDSNMIVNIAPHVSSNEDQEWVIRNFFYTTPSFTIWPSGRIDMDIVVDDECLLMEDVSLEDIQRFIRPVPDYTVWRQKDEEEKMEADRLTSYLSKLAEMWVDWNNR